MPTGFYKRTKYHLKCLKEGAESKPPMTKAHRIAIGEGVKKYWKRKNSGIKICSCCGRPFKRKQ